MSSSSLHVLLFNVRGLDLRWQEVLLLISSLKFDALILVETGEFNIWFHQKIFQDYRLLYQKGENRNGGVLILIKESFSISRVPCSIPNICVVDIKGEDNFRIIGVYAPDSKSWSWDDLSAFVSSKCVIYGDFNVDIMDDGKKADTLLHWADDQSLAHVVPNSHTSLRSNRVIDYAFIKGLNLDIQVYNGNTTSDHLPILSVISLNSSQYKLGKNIHWKVFSLFSEYTFSFWEENWNLSSIDITYNNYIRFLYLLSGRCTIVFNLNKYRSALPVEIRSFLSYIRALSFRQLRTKCSTLKKEVCFLKKIAKKELNIFYATQLDNLIRLRNSSSSSSFWYRSKRFFKPSSSSLYGFIDTSGQIVKECDRMCNLAADYYENFFKASTIFRPHPYTDSPPTVFDNISESIPEVTLDELLNTVISKKKKKSLDAHGLSNHMFNFLDLNYWSLLLNLYNHSFQKSILPSAWKDTRMILLAKKDSICPPSLTRPISLLDSFQKIGEKLFLTRFCDLLARRGLLSDSQSGFREHFRLQTRLLLFLEDIYSLMSNSAPVCTVFVDFRAAFDQLWYLGCIGKLRNLGIPPSYLNWIEAWLVNGRCYIEINGSYFSTVRIFRSQLLA
ncbi:unnamed protein product [Rotaria magnacalcarata]